MKGVVFNIVHEVVEQHLGAEVWDEALDRADVDGVYTSLGSYADDDLEQLVGSLGDITNLSRAEVLVFAGRHGFRHLASRHPDLIAPYDDWRAVLDRLDDIIHPEVAKIYPGADVPTFTVDDAQDGGARVVYESRRQLCDLAEGLVLGLGEWFRVALSVEHVECRRRGDASCTLLVVEAPPDQAPVDQR